MTDLLKKPLADIKPSNETTTFYKHVHDEVMSLIVTRQMFDGLYRETDDVDLLNRVAGQTFGFIQRLFFDALLMQAAKLFDTDDDAVSLPRLVTLVRNEGLKDFAKALNAKMPSADIRERVRLQRNKRVAHTDFDVRSGSATIQPVIMADVTSCIRSAREIINHYSEVLDETTLATGVLLDTKGGTHVLLRRLREAETYRNEHPDYWMPEGARAHLRREGEDPAAYALELKRTKGGE